MKTKFILHGGFSPGKKQQDDKFFQEMLKDTNDDVKILLVYFAESDEKVQLRTDEDTESFNKNKDSKDIQLRVASERTFEEDCVWADVIYLHGGKTAKLMESLIKYPNINQMLSGKTIAGDSAGAHALGKWFYSKNSKVVGKGLGTLPFKITAHYENGTHNPLAAFEPELETLLLHEYEIKIIQTNT